MPPVSVVFPFMGRELGGSHYSALGLIQHMDQIRYRPTIVLQHSDGAVFDLFNSAGADILISPFVAELEPGRKFGAAAALSALSSARRLGAYLKNLGARIVHCNDGRSNAVWSLPAKFSGAKLVWHNRGNPGARGLRFVAPFLPDRIISVSKFASPRPGIFSAASKNDVIHSPFDVTISADRRKARSALVAELAAPAEARLVGYFGLLVDRKRPLLFVETIARMQTGFPVIGLFFGEAYEGLAEKCAARARELGVADRIRFMGFRSPGPYWIAACDLLLVTAVGEPFGRTLIEAMLVETPVVATASGGNVEAIRDGVTGLLAPPEDAGALAAAAVRVLTDETLGASIAVKAKQYAQSNFGERRHADAVMAIYDRVLGLVSPSASGAD
ncbi:MAG TPA: mannosyltransferase [Parvularcula sp.]|nr:mannosyltransferase [Parvularcula sp.]